MKIYEIKKILPNYSGKDIIFNYTEIAQYMDKELIKLDKGEAHIIDGICVNSKHKARFLAKDNEDYCQCAFGDCKVMVSISYNGHTPYTYILTEQEIKNLSITNFEEIPLFKGTLEALDSLKIR